MFMFHADFPGCKPLLDVWRCIEILLKTKNGEYDQREKGGPIGMGLGWGPLINQPHMHLNNQPHFSYDMKAPS